MTLPSASWPNERPPDPDGEGEAAPGPLTPPDGAVSLADLIADSGPLPADAALECVQRIAERLTVVAHPFRSHLAPADVLVDDDGGVWIRESAAPGALDLNRSASRSAEMDRLGRLLAFVATGDGAHLADGAVIDPATLPAPLSTVASRLFCATERVTSPSPTSREMQPICDRSAAMPSSRIDPSRLLSSRTSHR